MQRLILLILFALLLSCTTKPPDVPLCVEINLSKGWCTYTIEDKEFFIDEEHPYSFSKEKPKTWWELRPTFVYMPADSWAEIKAFIIKVCKQSGKCDKEISSWQRKIDSIDRKLDEKN